MGNKNYDIIIVGASIAGATAAMLYAKEGFNVLVIDKKDVNSHKKSCTHFIQPSALHIISRLDIQKEIEDNGGIRSTADFWYGKDWIRGSVIKDSSVYAYNIERRILDPILKQKMLGYKSITFLQNTNVTKVLFENDIPIGISSDQQNTVVNYYSDIIIAADGKYSTIAKLINAKEEKFANDRVTFFGYYNNAKLKSGTVSQFWSLGENMAFAYPLQNDTVLLSAYICREQMDEWLINSEEKMYSLFSVLPDGPMLANSKLRDSVHRMLNIESIRRPAEYINIPFIGDAALALDPMSGVGCGFAFQSASWLVEHTVKGLKAGNKQELYTGIKEYAAYHTKMLNSHAKGIFADSKVSKNEKEEVFDFIKDSQVLSEYFIKLIYRLIQPEKFQLEFIKTKKTLIEK